MPGKGSGSREVRPHFTEQRNYTNTIPASAEKSSGANSWLRNLGYAAAAIIAALSVGSGRDGKYTGFDPAERKRDRSLPCCFVFLPRLSSICMFDLRRRKLHRRGITVP